MPVPQVTGHALQGSHADQLPLTKIMNTEFKKCIPKVFAIVGVGNAKFEQGRAYEHGHIFGDSKKIYFGFWENCKLRSISVLFCTVQDFNLLSLIATSSEGLEKIERLFLHG